MKLFVGLGNPGRTYQSTRHNVGFMFVDEVVSKLQGSWKLDKKLKGQIATVEILGEKHMFLKPMTFMNLSGESVVATLQFYKIDISNLVVIYDDLDLPIAQIKIKPKGSSGGHKGMASIIKLTGSQEFPRIRIGIDKSPVIKVTDYVLTKFTKHEQPLILKTIGNAVPILENYIKNDLDYIMNHYNTKTEVLV
jgi:PTH1 family peptidyl-tRNA hydrolase